MSKKKLTEKPDTSVDVDADLDHPDTGMVADPDMDALPPFGSSTEIPPAMPGVPGVAEPAAPVVAEAEPEMRLLSEAMFATQPAEPALSATQARAMELMDAFILSYTTGRAPRLVDARALRANLAALLA